MTSNDRLLGKKIFKATKSRLIESPKRESSTFRLFEFGPPDYRVLRTCGEFFTKSERSSRKYKLILTEIIGTWEFYRVETDEVAVVFSSLDRIYLRYFFHI